VDVLKPIPADPRDEPFEPELIMTIEPAPPAALVVEVLNVAPVPELPACSSTIDPVRAPTPTPTPTRPSAAPRWLRRDLLETMAVIVHLARVRVNVPTAERCAR
jgi:hypothetical protein